MRVKLYRLAKQTLNPLTTMTLTFFMETCEWEISVRIESRIESADSRLQL